ncbi:MAG TPA: hypothetical protein VGJ93_09715 [Desulfuromonadaceae bacterium]|jgi:hypothetical protein
MVLGFNHNVVYKSEVFHVQTEDSGVGNPHIITLLYKGGVILCSKKTSYADILKIENLDIVVEELMKEQHKDLMRRLKSGEFDERAFSIPASPVGTHEILSPEPVADPIADLFSLSSSLHQSPSKSDISLLFDIPTLKTSGSVQEQPVKKDIAAKEAVSLDDAILTFFGAYEK